MTSYQKRKNEIRALKEGGALSRSLALVTKHYFLALARGQEAYAEQCKRAILKRLPAVVPLTAEEAEEIRRGKK